MEYVLIILAAALIVFAFYLFSKVRTTLDELQKLKDDISQLKNIGDLLSVTEATLEEADRTISTAKKIMDSRIKKMEELLARYDQAMDHSDSRAQSTNSRSSALSDASKVEAKDDASTVDFDKRDRELIAQRNRRIILMLEEKVPLEEIARRTNASMREIRLIQKLIAGKFDK